MGTNWSWKWIFRTRWSHLGRFQKPINYWSAKFTLVLVHFNTLALLAAAFHRTYPKVPRLFLPIIHPICIQSRGTACSGVNPHLQPTHTYTSLQAGGQENPLCYWSFRQGVLDYLDPPGWSIAGLEALPTYLPDFVTGTRFTQDCANSLDLDLVNWLWPEEVKLVWWIVQDHELAFTWMAAEWGCLKEEYFPPVIIPAISHMP